MSTYLKILSPLKSPGSWGQGHAVWDTNQLPGCAGGGGLLSSWHPAVFCHVLELRLSTACLACCDEVTIRKVLASDSGELGPWPRSNQLSGEVTPLVFHVILWKILILVNSSAWCLEEVIKKWPNIETEVFQKCRVNDACEAIVSKMPLCSVKVKFCAKWNKWTLFLKKEGSVSHMGRSWELWLDSVTWRRSCKGSWEGRLRERPWGHALPSAPGNTRLGHPGVVWALRSN